MVGRMASVYYTGKGDSGTTGLLGKGRVRKNDKIIEAIGEIDELNSFIGLSRIYVNDQIVSGILKYIQNDLFVIGANLASLNTPLVKGFEIKLESIERLENGIRLLGEKTPELRQFVIPSGSEAALYLHIARSVARRAERRIEAIPKRYAVSSEMRTYMNRLSSFIFVAALYLNHSQGIVEEHPTY
jgi:cob(I)alamin adenosyltransferase